LVLTSTVAYQAHEVELVGETDLGRMPGPAAQSDKLDPPPPWEPVALRPRRRRKPGTRPPKRPRARRKPLKDRTEADLATLAAVALILGLVLVLAIAA
jgi:hypothetical protein